MANKSAEKRLDKQIELERQREWQKVRIGKAEEIYASLIKFNSLIFSTHMQWVSFARKETTLDKMVENIEAQPKNDAPLMKARIGVYFPELLPDFIEIKNLTEPANKCYFSMVSGKNIDDAERREFIKIIFESNERFIAGIDSLLAKLSNKISEQ